MADNKDLKNLTYSINFEAEDEPLKKITDKEKDIDDGFKKIGETLEETAKGAEKSNESSKGLLDTLMNVFGIQEKNSSATKTLTETMSDMAQRSKEGIQGVISSLNDVETLGSKIGNTVTDIVSKTGDKADVLGNKITGSITSIAEKMGIIKQSNNENNEELQRAETYLDLMAEKAAMQSRITRDLYEQYNKLVERLGYTNDEAEKFKMKLINAQIEEQKLNEQVDKAGEALQRAQEKVEGVAGAFTKADESSNKLNETTKKVSSGVGSMLAAFGFMGVAFTVADGIKGATKAYADFQQEMARTHAVLGDVSQKDLQGLSDKALDLSNKFGIASKDIAGAEESLGSNGLNAQQVMGTLQSAVTLATAGNIKMEDSANDVATAMKNFGLGADSANHIVDVYAKTAADTASELPDIATAMKYIGPIAEQVGWNIEGVSAAVGQLSDAGVKGSKAGTTLREIVSRLINPTGNAAKLIQNLGFSAVDPTTHKFKDLTDILKDLNTAMEAHGLTNAAEKNSALEIIFGQQGFTGVSALMKAPDDIQKLADKLQNADGAGKKMADTMNDTVQGAFNRFKEGVTNAFITNIDKTELGKTLKDFLNSMTNNLPEVSKSINTVLKDAIKFASFIQTNWSTLAPIIAGVAGAYATLKAVGTITSIVKNFKELGDLATPVGLFAAAIGLAAAAVVEFKQGNTGIGIVLSGLALGIGYVATAMVFLDAVSWPVVAAIGAVTLVVLGVYEAYKHWNDIMDDAKSKLQMVELVAAIAWDGITKTTNDAINAIIWDLNTMLWPINAVIDGLNKITGSKISEVKIPSINIKTNAAESVAKDIQKSNALKGSSDKTHGTTPMGHLAGAYAEGTSFAPGGLSLVGERGPELVNLPRGAKVTPNSMLSSALQNNSNLNFSNSINQYDKQINKMQPIFTQYGRQLNTNLGGGISQSQEQVLSSINNTTSNTGSRLQNFVNQSHSYGTGIDSELRAGIQESEQSVIDIVNDLANKVINQFKVTFGIHSPSRVTRKLGNFVGQGFALGLGDMDVNSFIKSWIGDTSSLAKGGLGTTIKSLLSPMFTKGDNKGIIGMIYGLLHGGSGLSGLSGLGGAISGNLSQWITMAMALTGVGSDWLAPLVSIIQHESGGDPHSINLWDSNAAAGHPSKGLMQLIDENMSDYHLPGMTDIWDPISNIAAGIRYIQATYHSIANVPGVRAMSGGGSYVGYAKGTSNARPGIAEVAENGMELVLGRQFRNFQGGEQVIPNGDVQKLMSNRSYVHNSRSTSNNITIKPEINININGAGKDGKSIADEVKRVLQKEFGNMFDGKMEDLINTVVH